MKTKDTSTTRLLGWLDDHGLALITGFLLVFIPLYPKLPLAEIIPGYIVRVRLEDFFILAASIFWLIQVYRGKARVHLLMAKLIGLYLLIGFLSTLSAMFITQTVPLEPLHYGKMYLHYLRRIEYFALFFIAYSAIRSMTHFRTMIYSIMGTTVLVTIYGFGQKYLYWPLYSTMNREFSKGVRLYLTEHARVPSTFGGHYDAAAYIMMTAAIILALTLIVKNRWLKLVGFASYIMAFWMLILTASRTSFVAYLGAITAVMLVAATIRSWKWALPRWIAVMAFSVAVMLSFGDLSERYTQALGLDRIRDQFSITLLAPKVDKPDDYKTLEDIFDEETAKVASRSDQQPTTEKPSGDDDSSPARPLPGDVYEDIPETVDELDEEGKPTGRKVQQSRTFSENAYKYGLSMAIRLDALWPRAIAGFMSNPLLGSGYSTLTKEGVYHFTEAESTDNDYLRALGETGLLGFLSFFAIVTAGIGISYRGIKRVSDRISRAYLVGFVAASIGLLLNAVYIDVFVASKVATMYWAFTGIALAIVTLSSKSNTKNTTTSKKNKDKE